MNIIKTEKFSFHGNEYEVRVSAIDGGFEVRAFLGDKPANGYVYSVSDITNFDFRQSKGMAAYDHLVEIAKSDVQNRYWEKYLAAIGRNS
jgi:hypothetical protein